MSNEGDVTKQFLCDITYYCLWVIPSSFKELSKKFLKFWVRSKGLQNTIKVPEDNL
jgi:hypothetical protein